MNFFEIVCWMGIVISVWAAVYGVLLVAYELRRRYRRMKGRAPVRSMNYIRAELKKPLNG